MPTKNLATSASPPPRERWPLPARSGHSRLVHTATITAEPKVFLSEIQQSLAAAASSSMPYNVPTQPPRPEDGSLIWEATFEPVGVVTTLRASTDGTLTIVEYIDHEPSGGAGVGAEVACLVDRLTRFTVFAARVLAPFQRGEVTLSWQLPDAAEMILGSPPGWVSAFGPLQPGPGITCARSPEHDIVKSVAVRNLPEVANFVRFSLLDLLMSFEAKGFPGQPLGGLAVSVEQMEALFHENGLATLFAE